jgi:hypothetical protein
LGASAASPAVVMMSANLDEASRAAALASGAIMCLNKHDLAVAFDATVSAMMLKLTTVRMAA